MEAQEQEQGEEHRNSRFGTPLALARFNGDPKKDPKSQYSAPYADQRYQNRDDSRICDPNNKHKPTPVQDSYKPEAFNFRPFASKQGLNKHPEILGRLLVRWPSVLHRAPGLMEGLSFACGISVVFG